MLARGNYLNYVLCNNVTQLSLSLMLFLCVSSVSCYFIRWSEPPRSVTVDTAIVIIITVLALSKYRHCDRNYCDRLHVKGHIQLCACQFEGLL